MSVEIEPQELGFTRPFTVEVLENLKIKNPGTQPVAFKVKTTAPKQYCVRPNSGRVEPNREVEVQVILQAMKQEPPSGAKCKDKFLVQSVAISPEKDFSNLASIWDTIDKSSVVEKKIRVAFLDPKSSPSADAPAAMSTPIKNTAVNVGSEATPEVSSAAFSSPRNDDAARSEPKSSLDEEPLVESSDAPVAAAAAATTRYLEPSREEPKVERKIAQPKEDDSGLRQRKSTTGVTADEKPLAKPVEQLAQVARGGTEGVPIHYTAALCLLSFLLAYFFF
ncbi:putative integral ER membrane protein Scs2 [Astrocystis sublimbata]|nr:putative integral ER membrane protein Scs2 [Astrocystis sublimbata]